MQQTLEGLTDLQSVVDAVYGYFMAMGITMTRVMAIVSIIPIFPQIGLTGLLRFRFVVAVALSLMPYTMSEMQQFGDFGIGHLAAIVLKEGFIGFVFGLPFWGVQ